MAKLLPSVPCFCNETHGGSETKTKAPVSVLPVPHMYPCICLLPRTWGASKPFVGSPIDVLCRISLISFIGDCNCGLVDPGCYCLQYVPICTWSFLTPRTPFPVFQTLKMFPLVTLEPGKRNLNHNLKIGVPLPHLTVRFLATVYREREWFQLCVTQRSLSELNLTYPGQTILSDLREIKIGGWDFKKAIKVSGSWPVQQYFLKTT